MSKKLVVYFSCSGVTRSAAAALAKAAGADIFEIKPEVLYTDADLDWNDQKSRSTIEMKDPNFRPAIAEKLSNMADYDVVYIGYPIWWGLAPTIVNGFIESYDFSNKIIVPFFTSGSSGLGSSASVLQKLCSPTANWKAGKRLSGRPSERELNAIISEA